MKPKEIFADAVVLIESDWNLKVSISILILPRGFCINRIRLEFKEKGCRVALRKRRFVLIESDWNLKSLCESNESVDGESINRIRLEFKGC